ncbi:hypothetical protein Tco_1217991 [Tanacetum coccineum]
MSTMAENVIASEAENRPMLEKSQYDSWQSLEVLPTPNTSASTRERTLADLTPEEKICEPEWSKFVTNVKLAKDMHNVRFDQLYADKCTDISEVTRKQSKNEQARTRESEEYKKKPKNQSRSQEKSNPQSKWSNHGQQKAPKQDGKEKSVISSDLTSSHSRGDTVTAWQSSSVHNDPTANIQDPMIAMIGWQRLKDWQRLKGPRSFSLSL